MSPNLKALIGPFLKACLIVAGYLVVQYCFLSQWHGDLAPNTTTEAINRTISLAFGYLFGYLIGKQDGKKTIIGTGESAEAKRK